MFPSAEFGDGAFRKDCRGNATAPQSRLQRDAALDDAEARLERDRPRAVVVADDLHGDRVPEAVGGVEADVRLVCGHAWQRRRNAAVGSGRGARPHVEATAVPRPVQSFPLGGALASGVV